jgi:hypothetical protein
MIFAQDAQNIAAGLIPQRNFYLSLDVDFSRLPVKQKWAKVVFFALNHIKIPAPTIGFNQNGLQFYPLFH